MLISRVFRGGLLRTFVPFRFIQLLYYQLPVTCQRAYQTISFDTIKAMPLRAVRSAKRIRVLQSCNPSSKIVIFSLQTFYCAKRNTGRVMNICIKDWFPPTWFPKQSQKSATRCIVILLPEPNRFNILPQMFCNKRDIWPTGYIVYQEWERW